jgi:DNA polymerase-1
MSSEVVIDIETNGLTPDTIWCLCDSEGTVATEGYNFKEGVTYYGHNAISFDYPVLASLWGCDISNTRKSLRDTLVLSRLACPSRAGGHSLDNWGDTLGFAKGDHSDWSQYSEDMLTYCKRDVSLTERVLQVLRGELEGFSEQSIELEHQVARIIQEQMDNGWLLDQRAVHDLLAELVEKKYEYEEAVRETFKPIAKAVKEITPKTNKDGSTSVVGLKYLGDNCLDLCGGPHTRI